jgi:hypothetical protein
MTAKEGSEESAVESAIDELYQAPLDRFTADRNARAAELRKAGDRENADRVKALPKPTVTAWAVNQAWWNDQPTFQAMFEASEALRAEHVALTQGRSADVRAAAEQRQHAIDAVVTAAVQALGGSSEVTPDARHRIAGTVEALASSGAPPDAAVGRLHKDLQSSGFAALAALAGLAPASMPRTPSPPSRPVIVSRTAAPKPAASKREERGEAKAEAAARERAERIATAKADLASRQAALRAAKAEATETTNAEKKAQTALEAATARVAELEAKLEAAQDAERAARRAVTQATKAASEAEMIEARTVRDVNHAREQLEKLK